jgi:hypothetical protein
MAAAKRKRASARERLEADDEVPVRVSSRSPRAPHSTPPVTRAQNLAVGLLEAMIGQLADYIENSHAIERLIRAQMTQVLRELTHDPKLTAWIRAQAQEFLQELAARPEILEPLVRAQVDRYLAHLEAEKDKRADLRPPIVPKPKRAAKKVKLD